MKTLKEVIKALENVALADTDGESEGYFLATDSLHYLKEYQMLQIAYLKAMADLEDNPPLTWSELRTMEGKPVWVEGEHGCILNQRSWVLIRLDDENDDLVICYATDNGHYEFAIGEEDYGTDWQAYRKERL